MKNGTQQNNRTTQTTGYYLAFIALGLSSAVLGPTLPDLAEHTQTQLGDISFLFAASSLGYLFGALLGGRLYDRLPGHRVMAIALGGIMATMLLIPLIPLLWLLAAVLLLSGIVTATLDVGGNTLLVWVHQDKVGPYMNGLHFFFGVGTFLAPIVIAQTVLASGDITWAYWILAALMSVALIWLLKSPSPTNLGSAQDNPAKQANPILVALIAIFFFLYVGAEVAVGGWIYTYAVTLKLSNETLAAYLTSAFWGAFTLGRLLAIPIAARLKPSHILLGSLAGSLIGVVTILLGSNSLAVTWIGTLGVGLSMASVFPTTLSLAERRMTLTGRVTSWFFVGASIGGMSLPWLVGQLFEPFGPQIAMSTVAASLIAAIGVYAVLNFHSERERSEPQA